MKDFEITIRMMGGLLSSYELTGDKRLLALADDLGTRMLPMFNSPTGMPYEYVNLRTGAVRGVNSNPAEVGSMLIEYGVLARLTGKPMYYDKAKRAVVGAVSTSVGDWAGRFRHQRGNREVDGHNGGDPGRDRLLLRISFEGGDTVSRSGLRAHVEAESAFHQQISGG